MFPLIFLSIKHVFWHPGNTDALTYMSPWCLYNAVRTYVHIHVLTIVTRFVYTIFIITFPYDRFYEIVLQNWNIQSLLILDSLDKLPFKMLKTLHKKETGTGKTGSL